VAVRASGAARRLPPGRQTRLDQIPAQLVRSIEMPRTVRLEFAGGIQVELARPEFEKQKLNKEWLVWFPPDALRVI